MNKDEIIAREEHRANWQEEARARANQEGLTGDEAIKRALEIYEELREIGEGI